MINLILDNEILANAILELSSPTWVEKSTFWVTLISAVSAILLWLYERGNENKSKVDIIDADKKNINELKDNLEDYIYNTISDINLEKNLKEKNLEKIKCLITIIKEHSKECGFLPILNILYDLKHLITSDNVNKKTLKEIVEKIRIFKESNNNK